MGATFTAMTTLARQSAAERLGECLEALDPAPAGVGVFELEDDSGLWEVGAYFTGRPDGVALDILAAAHGARPFAVSELPETDWVATVQRELHPIAAGRFYLHGAHDAGTAPDRTVPLLIEAAMAFGTGHHGTTQGCLAALERLIVAGEVPDRVADIGCGTAVLAIAAARVWGRGVIAGDIDPVAVEVAQANAEVNGVGHLVACVQAAGLEHPKIAAVAPFGLVFANILMGPLVDLAPAIAGATGAGSHAILSGLLTPQADEVVATYRRVGFDLADRDDIGDWATLTLRRR